MWVHYIIHQAKQQETKTCMKKNSTIVDEAEQHGIFAGEVVLEIA